MLPHLPQPKQIDRLRTPAGIGWRLAAWLLDTSLAFVPASLLAIVMTAGLRNQMPQLVNSYDQAEIYLMSWVSLMIAQAIWTLAGVVLIYGIGSIFAEGGSQHATWGKRWLGLETTDLMGEGLSRQQAAVRFVSGSLSWLTLNIGHAMAAFRKDRRTLHDIVAGTRVWMDEMDLQQRVLRALAAVGGSILLGMLPMLLSAPSPMLRQSINIMLMTGGMAP